MFLSVVVGMTLYLVPFPTSGKGRM